jgi:hypothetical protein
MEDVPGGTPQHRRAIAAAEAPAPTLGQLIAEVHALARRDGLPLSGHIVVESRGKARHRHDVWVVGPFAIISGGWFGMVHGAEHADGKAPRWLAKHERRCRETHWTQFSWIDESAVEPGCGREGIGIGSGPDGPVYCALTAGNATDGEHVHVPMVQVLRQGLRELAARR